MSRREAAGPAEFQAPSDSAATPSDLKREITVTVERKSARRRTAAAGTTDSAAAEDGAISDMETVDEQKVEVDETKSSAFLSTIGLTKGNAPKDGSCLFHSFAACFKKSSRFIMRKPADLRTLACEYMEKHSLFFVPIWDGKLLNGSKTQSFPQYLQSMEQAASWGGELELLALALHLDITIFLFRPALPTIQFGKANKAQHAYGLIRATSLHLKLTLEQLQLQQRARTT